MARIKDELVDGYGFVRHYRPSMVPPAFGHLALIRAADALT
ncbi:MAG: hypothetical protein ACOX61_00130 [Brooklawnia sp.]